MPEKWEMKSKNMQRPQYDKNSMQVRGREYYITLAGTSIRDEILGIFFYQDDNTNFYFLAERQKWTKTPTSKNIGEVNDTETYAIRRLWCGDVKCVRKKESISEISKNTARKNILEGMMLMEERCGSPPKGVFIQHE